MTYLAFAQRILLTAWVGGLWAIGYIAAPTLFATLDDRAMADKKQYYELTFQYFLLFPLIF